MSGLTAGDLTNRRWFQVRVMQKLGSTKADARDVVHPRSSVNRYAGNDLPKTRWCG